jgi:hypothetical protein
MKRLMLKNDKYRKSRGGYSRLLDISCENCGKHVCFYQKDGPGILKRMYVDRIVGIKSINPKANLVCPSCKEILGVPVIYKKEKRPAYRLFTGAILKKISKI